MMWCGVVWCGVVWCGVVWCGVMWCSVVWYSRECFILDGTCMLYHSVLFNICYAMSMLCCAV